MKHATMDEIDDQALDLAMAVDTKAQFNCEPCRICYTHLHLIFLFDPLGSSAFFREGDPLRT